MTRKEKTDKIHKLVIDMLVESHEAMTSKVKKILNSGCIDIDSWSEDDKPMILPISIQLALLQNEASYCKGKGTSYQKEIRKEVSNIENFL